MPVFDADFSNYLDELCTFLRIPSVSTDPKCASSVREAAEWVKSALLRVGLSRVNLLETDGFPVVYGEWLGKPDRPTVLFYGHYDVQPPEPLHLWQNPAFEPVVRDGQLVARGVSDDKGQIFCHFKALERLYKKTGELPVNIKILIEGEEEIGSPSLAKFIESNKELLAADLLVVSDTPMFARNQPSVCTSLRGLVYFQIDVRTANSDLHSGQHGGAVPNAIQVLVDILSQLKDQTGRILIPGFYDNVIDYGIDQLNFDEAAYQDALGCKGLVGEEGYTALERRWYRPTLDINGIQGGYTGEGAKTVITCEAFAKLSCRLVANQDPVKIAQQVEAYLNSLAPGYASVTVQNLTAGHEAGAVRVDSNNVGVQAALNALESVWGVKPVLQGEGGSIPVLTTFQKLLGLSPILIGLNLPEDKIHAPNEQFSLENFRRGILVAEAFYQSFLENV
ncbi:MAG: dipeptidase [Candidatus Margulisbacteria bacterium]|nr:dipeptidase [Candidatus Margulisiibacteriota bacterium]